MQGIQGFDTDSFHRKGALLEAVVQSLMDGRQVETYRPIVAAQDPETDRSRVRE